MKRLIVPEDGSPSYIIDVPDDEGPPPYTPTIPQQISLRQCRLELLNRGLLDDVDAMLQQASREVQVEWEYASTVDRNSALVNEMAAVLGLTTDQVDAMFLSASLL